MSKDAQRRHNVKFLIKCSDFGGPERSALQIPVNDQGLTLSIVAQILSLF